MDTDKLLPTRGQLERHISQTLQTMYRNQFGHSPRKVTCHFFDDKLAIVAENALTNVERVLLDNSQQDLALNIRSQIDQAFVTNIKQEIVNLLGVEIVDTIVDSVLQTGYLGIILFLSDVPKVRINTKEGRKSAANIAVKTSL